MKLGSLFSGGGLGDFGFMAAGMKIAWQCEIDEYCQKILELRYPESKKYRDIKSLKGAELEKVDIITGGFPCQPFSVAGKQKGKEDNRYLWPEMLRVIEECKPRWVIGENVPGIINLALDTVCIDLEAKGYEVWPIVFPSHALGAWHKRDRLWVVCHAKHDGQLASQESRGSAQGNDNSKTREKQASESTGPGKQYALMENSRCTLRQGGFIRGTNEVEDGEQDAHIPERPSQASGEAMANTEGVHAQGCYGGPWERKPWGGGWWESEPNVGRVAHGIADRVHRLKMLGNGQVPCCTYVLGKFILDIERQMNEKV